MTEKSISCLIHECEKGGRSSALSFPFMFLFVFSKTIWFQGKLIFQMQFLQWLFGHRLALCQFRGEGKLKAISLEVYFLPWLKTHSFLCLPEWEPCPEAKIKTNAS